MNAYEKYKSGKWTTCNIKVHSDGTRTVTIYDAKSSGKKHLTFKAKNLNRRNQQIIQDEGE